MKKVESSAQFAALPEGNFHIDISRTQPYVVRSDGSFEVPLTTLSKAELIDLRMSATRQLILSVHEDHDAMDEHRATLFYIARWANQRECAIREAADRRAAPRRRAFSPGPASQQPV